MFSLNLLTFLERNKTRFNNRKLCFIARKCQDERCEVKTYKAKFSFQKRAEKIDIFFSRENSHLNKKEEKKNTFNGRSEERR